MPPSHATERRQQHLDLPIGIHAAARARDATAHFLHEAKDHGERVSTVTEGDAALVVTELVSNAVRHTTGPCSLDLLLHEGLLDIDVTDTSPAPPEVRPPHMGGTGGWGLILIHRVARAVTVTPAANGGKRVHACLDVDGVDAAAGPDAPPGRS
ncbi:ATP-binding protein [Streptomyces sp. NPDC051555]|uniref:ATP-binding protein n=1 Tax=Streptomyces sp. NPDC051555 TaxID=3365657 RepID=UPI0037BB9A88